MKTLKALRGLVDRIVSIVGRVILEVTTAIGLIVCASCIRMGICAIIHSLSYSAHAWRETYWSGVEESAGGFLATLLSFAAAIMVAYFRYLLTVDNNTSEISETEKGNTTANASVNKQKETQESISFLYFFGFVIASILWVAKSSPTKTHWTDSMMGEVSLNAFIALVLCILFMLFGSALMSFYSEEKTNI